MVGLVYTCSEPEDPLFKQLSQVVLPRLSMLKSICHSDRAPSDTYTFCRTVSAWAYLQVSMEPLLLGQSLPQQAYG
jgi:hypothetical protein